MQNQPVTQSFSIRPLTDSDRQWVAQFCAEQWGADLMIVHGDHFYISQLPGFIAEIDGQPAGLITYTIRNGNCEITSLDSLQQGVGIGTAFVDMIKFTALQLGCQSIRVTTTNDNIDALLFYQKRGFVFHELRRCAVIESRKIKPQIPLYGNYGLPIRDEIELEIDFAGQQPL